jgi:hypothetical protein
MWFIPVVAFPGMGLVFYVGFIWLYIKYRREQSAKELQKQEDEIMRNAELKAAREKADALRRAYGIPTEQESLSAKARLANTAVPEYGNSYCGII